MVVLNKESLHASVCDPVATSMNFLNEIAGRYPSAISLAAGRPYEGFHTTGDISRYIDTYTAYLAAQGHGEAQIRRALTQYGRTNGQIHPLIAHYLDLDEGIRVPADAIAVTAGCQEAMVIALRGLCSGPDDVLLVVEPCYVGITGAARLLDIEVIAVPGNASGVDPAAVANAARRVREVGKHPRALYVVPDFANPSGLCLDIETRQALLDVAEAEDFLILEDDPYGLFGRDDRPRPKLKALDRNQRVIYLGSFAKSCFPGARIGFLVADQQVADAAGRITLLADELSNIKSMLTVNTSPIGQAVVGGYLLESGGSLRAASADKVEFYRNNLAELLAALDRTLPPPWREAAGVTWNSPDGGFFAVLDVPFTADVSALELSAEKYGVLWTPMSFFYVNGGGRNSIRICSSAFDPATLAEGIGRLADFIRDQVEAQSAPR